jgi:hypothetical protein
MSHVSPHIRAVDNVDRWMIVELVYTMAALWYGAMAWTDTSGVLVEG